MMCYSGRCKYEDYCGECTLSYNEKYPDDAGCIETDKIIEEAELIELSKNSNV